MLKMVIILLYIIILYKKHVYFYILEGTMGPYKAKKYPIEYKLDKDLLRLLSISFVLFVVLLLSACSKVPKDKKEVGETLEIKDENIQSTLSIEKIEGLSDNFMLGVDISSIL